MSRDGLMTIIQCFCAGSSPFSSPKRHHSRKAHPLKILRQSRGCSNTRATGEVGISVHHSSPRISLGCWGSCSPRSPALLRWLLNQGLKPVRGSCQLVSLSGFFQKNSLAFLGTATPGVIYGASHELYTIIMHIMERDRAMRSSASLQRPLYLSPCFTLSYVHGLGASPCHLIQCNVPNEREHELNFNIYQYLKLPDLPLHKTHPWHWVIGAPNRLLVLNATRNPMNFGKTKHMHRCPQIRLVVSILIWKDTDFICYWYVVG